MRWIAAALALLGVIALLGVAGCRSPSMPRASDHEAESDLGRFAWRLGPPLVTPAPRPGDVCVAVKDPSLVRYDGRWHLFTTSRCRGRSHAIEYRSFSEWSEADRAASHVLAVAPGYAAAPQVFHFTPTGLWVLVMQIPAPGRGIQPGISTTRDIANPASWTVARPLVEPLPDAMRRGIDFWLIADATRVHLFYTTLDGRLWRAETPLSDFPSNWSAPVIALQDDLFEASHTYRLGEAGEFLSIVEAVGEGGRRYQKAYLAERLDGGWRPLAASAARPFASVANVRDLGEHWADSISHGELIRAGVDEHLVVDPKDLRFVFQGATDTQMRDVPYGAIPWRLGILEPDARGPASKGTDQERGRTSGTTRCEGAIAVGPRSVPFLDPWSVVLARLCMER